MRAMKLKAERSNRHKVEDEETRREEFEVELAGLCIGDVRGAGNGLAVLPGFSALEARPWLAARNATTLQLSRSRRG